MNRNVIVMIFPLLICCTTKPSNAVESIYDLPKKYPLSVWSITPSWGVMDEDTILVVHGAGFQEGAKVYIGDKKCREPSVKTQSIINCEQPKQLEPGYYAVTVENPDGEVKPDPSKNEEDPEEGQLMFYYRAR
jgi:hypothetical protein